jgi:mono/diheme cytochrome c family protein
VNPVRLKPEFFWAAIFAVPLLCANRTASAVDYLADIKPILREHCYRCHGARQQKGGLRLDTAEYAGKGGEAGAAVVPGKAAESIMIQALRGIHPTISQMPYKKPALPEEQIALIVRWIDTGAMAPLHEEAETAKHWAFSPPSQPVLPELSDRSRVRSPADRFIQKRLEADKILPAPDADRAVLIRRLSLDLTGLPPTPVELETFLSDRRADAYERLVERLLASPHYGERWGRWWLDAARYADSNGYSIDAPRQIWKYRDWVVAALNGDQSFAQFVIEQLAGDLLPDATVDQKIATGFNRNTQINQEGGIDPEQFRVESVMDRVNTFGTVFLGLTVGCAQCHDHKFDPISQREYYQLYAFFNSTEEDGHGKAAPLGMMEVPGEFMPLDEKVIEEARAELDRYLNTKGSVVLEWERTNNIATSQDWSERAIDEKRAAYKAFQADDPEFKSRDDKVAKLEKRAPRPVTTLVMQELAEPRETFRFIKGDFTRPGEKVQPGVPSVLHEISPSKDPAFNRLDLARWVVDPRNPLLARVIVNRVWQQYFGRGLVETENDFGTQGSLPSHPELLDWLACEFMAPTASGARAWSLKHLHRTIVNSTTYRQASRNRTELAGIDPNNRLLARQSRLRLDSEVIRDAALVVSGLFAPEIGGPPVFPPQPDGVMNLGQVRREWKTSDGRSRYRRALYTHFWRATPHPALSVFDSADGFSSCTRRIRSNTPLQALTLLNDRQFYEFAQALSKRIERLPGGAGEKIENAFSLCLGRKPSAVEKKRLIALIEGETESPWLAVARVMLNLDETITRE